MAGGLERRAKAATFRREDHASMAEYVLGPCNEPIGGVLDSQEEAGEDCAADAERGTVQSMGPMGRAMETGEEDATFC